MGSSGMFNFGDLEETETDYYSQKPWMESSDAKRNRYRAMAAEMQRNKREQEVPVGQAGFGGAGGGEQKTGKLCNLPVIGASDMVSMITASYQARDAMKGTRRPKDPVIELESAVFMEP